MKITFTIPDDKLNLIKTAFLKIFNYQKEIYDKEGNLILNPITEDQFIKHTIINYIKSVVEKYEREENIKNFSPTEIEIT